MEELLRQIARVMERSSVDIIKLQTFKITTNQERIQRIINVTRKQILL